MRLLLILLLVCGAFDEGVIEILRPAVLSDDPSIPAWQRNIQIRPPQPPPKERDDDDFGLWALFDSFT